MSVSKHTFRNYRLLVLIRTSICLCLSCFISDPRLPLPNHLCASVTIGITHPPYRFLLSDYVCVACALVTCYPIYTCVYNYSWFTHPYGRVTISPSYDATSRASFVLSVITSALHSCIVLTSINIRNDSNNPDMLFVWFGLPSHRHVSAYKAWVLCSCGVILWSLSKLSRFCWPLFPLPPFLPLCHWPYFCPRVLSCKFGSRQSRNEVNKMNDIILQFSSWIRFCSFYWSIW